MEQEYHLTVRESAEHKLSEGLEHRSEIVPEKEERILLIERKTSTQSEQ
jgi:hypothetical protein